MKGRGRRWRGRERRVRETILRVPGQVKEKINLHGFSLNISATIAS